jgi:hypothetical protein
MRAFMWVCAYARVQSMLMWVCMRVASFMLGAVVVPFKIIA